MNKRAVVLAVAAVLLLLLAEAYLWGPPVAPSGQEPLVTLSNANFDGFQNAFDGDFDVPRLVLLLSPT
jgi:hypothetical protein